METASVYAKLFLRVDSGHVIQLWCQTQVQTVKHTSLNSLSGF